MKRNLFPENHLVWSIRSIKVFLFFIFLSVGTIGYGQTNGSGNTWTVLENTPDYILSCQVGTCNNQSIVFFKVENKTSATKCYLVSSRLKENGSNNLEILPTVYLCTQGQQTFTGDCNTVNVPRGYIQKAVYTGTYTQPVVTAVVVTQ